MSRPMRIVSAILAMALVLGAVAGIAFWTAGMDPDAYNPGYYEKGKKVENPQPILTIGDTPVPFDIYRHYFLLYKSYFQSYYGPNFYDDKNDPDGDRVLVLKQGVETELVNLYTWLKIAEEEGIQLTDEDRAEINTTLTEQKELYGDNFDSQLRDMFYTSEENYMTITEMQKLVEITREKYRTGLEDKNRTRLEEEADTDFDENFITAKHILISPPEDIEDPDEGIEAARLQAEDLYQQIMASKDPEATFNELMVEYTDDPGLETNPDGYTFTEGEMVEIFYETALALEIGGISEPVLSDTANYRGYHIIMRVPLNEEAREANRETFVTTAIDGLVTERENAIKETLPVTYSDFYDKFLASAIR